MLILKLNNKPTAEELASLSVAEPKIVGVRKLTGGEQVTELILTLSAHSLPAIVVFVLAKLRSNKHVEATFKGMKLKGISEETAERLLLELINKNDKPNN